LIELPLLLRRKTQFKQRAFVYEVMGSEPVETPLGTLQAVHLRPREPANEKTGLITVDFWFAPTLEYLPVRVKISQNEENYIDLVISEAPQRGAPANRARGASAASPASQ
jgi:hypothetical protein